MVPYLSEHQPVFELGVKHDKKNSGYQNGQKTMEPHIMHGVQCNWVLKMGPKDEADIKTCTGVPSLPFHFQMKSKQPFQ